VWIPASFDAQSLGPKDRQNRTLKLFARLRKQVSIREARAEASTILERLAQNDPHEKEWTANVVRLREAMVNSNIRAPISLLMAIVVFALLITCANVAGIFMARSATRQSEFAVRAALGAGRWRLIGQSLGETLCLALLSGGFGLLLAAWGV